MLGAFMIIYVFQTFEQSTTVCSRNKETRPSVFVSFPYKGGFYKMLGACSTVWAAVFAASFEHAPIISTL